MIIVDIEEIRPHTSGSFIVRYVYDGLRRAALIAPTAPGADDILSGHTARIVLSGGRIIYAKRVNRPLSLMA